MGPSNDLRTDNLNPVVLDEVDTNNGAALAGCGDWGLGIEFIELMEFIEFIESVEFIEIIENGDTIETHRDS